MSKSKKVKVTSNALNHLFGNVNDELKNLTVDKTDTVLTGTHKEIEKFKTLCKMSGENIGKITLEVITEWNAKNGERIIKNFM